MTYQLAAIDKTNVFAIALMSKPELDAGNAESNGSVTEFELGDGEAQGDEDMEEVVVDKPAKISNKHQCKVRHADITAVQSDNRLPPNRQFVTSSISLKHV